MDKAAEAKIIRAAMSLLGKRRSKKKAAQARANGKLGGRPVTKRR